MQLFVHKITKNIISRGWLDENQDCWCEYILMKYIGTLFFFLCIFFVALLCHKLLEALVFVSIVYSMRRRIGGWHAASALQCQVFSFLLTTTNVLAFGPILEKAPTPFLGLITIGLSVVALFVKPIYPAQLHFTDEIKKQNNRKKNHLVLLVILLQIIALANSPRFLGYFLLGMLDALLGVFAEAQSLRKRGEKNEQT